MQELHENEKCLCILLKKKKQKAKQSSQHLQSKEQRSNLDLRFRETINLQIVLLYKK